MIRDQYIPHEVSLRQTNEFINLIDEQGMAGYGIYWALLEYLRTQDDYIGDLRALRSLSHQYRTTPKNLLRIITEYGLFEVTDTTFRSQRLERVMEPLEKKRRMQAAQTNNEERKFSEQNLCNSLEIKDDSFIEKKNKGKVKQRKVSSTSSLKEEEKNDNAVVDDAISSTPLWECLVDSLKQEEKWKEITAKRCKLKNTFHQHFDRILYLFKQHILALGKEDEIRSLSDAKRYFSFYLTPGSLTYAHVMDEIKLRKDNDPYRYEYRDEETGKRMYCGVVIPDDAPPRPNEQSIWNPTSKKWTY